MNKNKAGYARRPDPPEGDLVEKAAEIIANELHPGEPACESCYKIARESLPLIEQEVREKMRGKAKIVCLCGSTRFVDTFNEWRKRLTYEGKIVLSIEIVTSQSIKTDPQHINPELKSMLDELHLRKIDLCDEVLVLNVNGYIGESTRKEITYAEKIGKPIKYLEALKGGK